MIQDIDIFSMIGDESFPEYENCLVHWSDVYALLSDWCVPPLGEVGFKGRDQSLQPFSDMWKWFGFILRDCYIMGLLWLLEGVAGGKWQCILWNREVLDCMNKWIK